MSTDYRLQENVLFQQLFDGRLQQYGIAEKTVPDSTSERSRVLVDEQGNFLWVYSDDKGYVGDLSRYGFQSPALILEAISVTFNTEIYSEHEPQYWGFNTQEEWDAWMAKMAIEHRNEFYADIVNFVTGKEHGFRSGTVGMIQAEIANVLVSEHPDLLLMQNKDEFLKTIDEKYLQGQAQWTITLDDLDLDLARRIASDTDGLPRDPNCGQHDFVIPRRVS